MLLKGNIYGAFSKLVSRTWRPPYSMSLHAGASYEALNRIHLHVRFGVMRTDGILVIEEGALG